jgi:hypothetical protein
MKALFLKNKQALLISIKLLNIFSRLYAEGQTRYSECSALTAVIHQCPHFLSRPYGGAKAGLL